MVIIKDKFYGDDLKLLKDRLLETVGHQSGYPYYVLYEDLRAAVKEKAYEIWVHGKGMTGLPNNVHVHFSRKDRKIGCRTFSPATFAKILKAAGVKPKAVRKTDKKRKPAKKGKK
jgi:hypothetical protein